MSTADRALDSRIARALASCYHLRSYAEFVGAGVGSRRELLPAETSPHAAPVFHGDRTDHSMRQNSISVSIPSIGAVCVEGAVAVGKCDLFFCDDKAVHADRFDVARHRLAEELHGVARVVPESRTIRVGISGGVRRLSVPIAVSLLGGATHNYVHWLTETLPKLLLLDGIEAYRGLPLLIDRGLHPNILESLACFDVQARPTIEVERHEPVYAERLVFVSPPTFVPFDHRAAHGTAAAKVPAEDLSFSPSAIRNLQTAAGRVAGSHGASQGRKIYLRRNSPYRRITNAAELEAVVVARGFEIVEPERMKFREQLELFRSTSCVIAQGGAALGNLCLTPPGCVVVALAERSPLLNYDYFAQLASILGHDFSHLLGSGAGSADRGSSDGDFRIDIEELKAALAFAESKTARLGGANTSRAA